MRYTDPTGNRLCEDADCKKTITTAQVNKIVKENEADKGDHHQPVVSKSNQQPSSENGNSNSSNDDYCDMARCPRGNQDVTPPKPDEIAIALDASSLLASTFSYGALEVPWLWGGLNLYTDMTGYIGLYRTMQSDPNAFSLRHSRGSATLTMSSDFEVGAVTASIGIIPFNGFNVAMDAAQLGWDFERREGGWLGWYTSISIPIP